MAKIKNQSASALITALFIMTLIAIAATAMSNRLMLDIFRTRMSITSDKMYFSSQAVTFWFMDYLHQKKIEPKFGSTIPFPDNKLTPIYPEIKTSGQLTDLQGLFNINNILNSNYVMVFDDLIKKGNPELTVEQRLDLIRNIRDWIADYKPGKIQNTPVEYYQKLNPAYQPGFQKLKSVSELRLIKGMSEKTFTALLPYITALPEDTSININAASQTLLECLTPQMNEQKAVQIQNELAESPISSPQELRSLATKYNLPLNIITFESQFYLSEAFVEAEPLTLHNFTILKRITNKSNIPSVELIWESLNTL